MSKKLYLSLTMLLACCTAGLFAGKIHDAVKSENFELVKKLIKENPDCLTEVNESGETALLIACKQDNIQILELLLSQYKNIYGTKTVDVFMPCLALEEDNSETMNTISSIINKPDKNGKTPLHCACLTKKNPKIIKLLLAKGADPNIADIFYDDTPFSVACENGNSNIAALLLPFCNKQTINKENRLTELTPIDHIFGKENKKNKAIEAIFILFVKNGVLDLNMFYPNGYSVLHWACENNFLKLFEIALRLCDKKMLSKSIMKGKTPLHVACEKNYQEIAKLLLEHTTIEAINETDNYGNTPLYWACKNNNLEIVKLIFEHITKINHPKYKQYIVNHFLTCIFENGNNLDMVILFLVNGVTVTQEIKDSIFDENSLCDFNRKPRFHEISYPIRVLLVRAEQYNKEDNIEEKIADIIKIGNKRIENATTDQIKQREKVYFYSLVKLCFGKSLESVIQDKKPLDSTAFYKIYNEENIELEDVFGIKKEGTCLDYIKRILQREDCEFYVAKTSKF